MRYLLFFIYCFWLVPTIAGASDSTGKAGNPISLVPAPLSAPSCSVAGADPNSCGADQDSRRLTRDAKAKEAPYQPKKSGLDSTARSIPCKITADCPPGLFCSQHGVCGVTAGLVGP